MSDRPYQRYRFAELRRLRSETEELLRAQSRHHSEERRHAPDSESTRTLLRSCDHIANMLSQINAEFTAREDDAQQRAARQGGA